ncbi:MASE1 domain-containing protein [Dyella flagellata]|nr:MASE1 domain-containing protein [Dyella flagellata]
MEWMKQVAVALGFALAYEAAHPFSPPQFGLGSALRLLWLLFLPYRYWPALAVGEFVPNFLAVYPCLEQFGALWVAFRSIPPLVFMMPVVWFCRARLALFPSKRLINIKALLVGVVATSLVLTAYTCIAMTLAHLQPNTSPATWGIASCFFIGFYFAMLAVVPWPLIARFELRPGRWREKLRRGLQSRLLLEGLTILLPITVLLALLSNRSGPNYAQFVLMAMFLPVAWLTLRHGWRGAALGGTFTLVGAVCVLPSQMMLQADPFVIQTEVFLALAITILFAVGARISEQLLQGQRANDDRHLARQSYQQGEQRLRNVAQALDISAGRLHLMLNRLLRQMQHLHPYIENEASYQQAMSAHQEIHQLAESIHPTAWRERGLPAALQESLGRALDDAGIAYRCHITGRGFTRMQPAVLAAAYRAACEAVAHISGRLACSSIRLTLRGGETHRMRWLVVRIEGVMDDAKVARAIHDAEGRRSLTAKLGASGLDRDQLREQVRIFDGELHYHCGVERIRLSVLLHDARASADDAAPVRLWVS